MKLFTVSEANDLLPIVRAKLLAIQSFYATIDRYRDGSRAAARASQAGGGMSGGSHYVKALYEVGKLTTELGEMGVQLKDYSRGLIDFPCRRQGRIVLLCWQLGEQDKIEWWHDVESGFAGRQPL